MKHARALVQPGILRWARSSAGLSLEEAAHLVATSVENVESWESDGGSHPSMPQLRKMARVYKRRLSDFFIPEAPVEGPIPHDFRRMPSSGAVIYSRELRYELRAAAERRQIALDLLEELGEEPVEVSASIARWDRPESVASRIRELLHIDTGLQARWRQPRTHYNQWRQRIEKLGVLVFQVTTVDADQMLGYSLSDRPLPVIGINRKLAPNGRTFTMLHELTHILLGQSGICDLDEEHFRSAADQKVEVFCNAVAAAALMPSKEFLAHPVVQRHGPESTKWHDYEFNELGAFFGASDEAVVRRLLTLGKTTKEFYEEKRRQFMLRRPKEPAVKEKMKRNMPQEVLSNLGRTYTQLVLNTYAFERLSLSDASRFLGLRANQVFRVRELVGA